MTLVFGAFRAGFFGLGEVSIRDSPLIPAAWVRLPPVPEIREIANAGRGLSGSLPVAIRMSSSESSATDPRMSPCTPTK
jgi:hypothetical protein